nr:stAR-related lipid transfer protein 13-like [Meriones unguiculatus]
MSVISPPCALQGDDSDEEDLCLSNKWTFQRTSRRWSRVDDPHTPLPGADGNGSPGAPEMTDAAIGQGVLADRRTDTLSARVAQGRLEGQGRASGQAISTPVLQQREPESFKAMSPHQESFKAKSQESFKAMSAQPESFKAMMQKQEPEFFKAMSQESFKAMSPHLESFKAMIQQQEPESFKAMMQQQEPESFKAMSPQRELESFKAMSQESFKAMLQEQESFKAMSPQQEPESFKAMSPQREQESFKAMSPQQEPESFKAMSPQREQESFKAISLQPESFKAMSQESFKAMFPELESFKAISPQPESFKAMLPESFKAMSPHQESFKAMSQESFKAMMQQQEPESFKAKSQESFTAMMQQLEPEPESFKAKSQESVKATPRPQVPNGHAPAPPRGIGRPGAASKRGGVYLEDLDVLSGAPGGRRGFRSQEDLLFLVPEDHTPGTFPKALSVESLSPAGGDGAGWRTAGHGEDSPPRAPRAGSRVSVYDNVPGSHLYASTGDLLDLERDGLLPGVGPILHPGTPPPGPSPPSPSPPDGRRAASPTGPSG